MRPKATVVCGLQLLVYIRTFEGMRLMRVEALRVHVLGTSVWGLKVLVYAALRY